MLVSSILTRREITNGSDILYYLENDIRYLHNPFLFNTMEDAVDRILSAKEEKEKVLVFGDRDVDGITSTTLLFQYLKDLGIDVNWRLPTGDDSYGLSIQAIDEFASNYGTLIITVDCGISNYDEIKHAKELGIDVIVTDHHNVTGELPASTIVVNPKVEGIGYPFPDISGCAVAYKLVTALRFSQSELYKQEICLLNVRPINEAYVVEGIKVVNGCEKARITETIIPGGLSFQETRLLPFLKGQQIFVWDANLQKKQLIKIFGNSIEFNMFDIRPEIAHVMPKIANLSLLRLTSFSKIARYQEKPATELDTFFNIFITFINRKTATIQTQERNLQDLQLVALAAISDIMPLKNENRIFVRKGLAAINGNKIRPGLLELLGYQNLLGKKIGSIDLSWNVIPVLNATGRLGKPELGVQLLCEQDPKKRDKLAIEIIELNKQRKLLGAEAWTVANKIAKNNLEKFSNKLVFVADKNIHRGVTGIVASKLSQFYKLPAIVITFLPNNTGVGSIRSCRGFDVTQMLESMSDLFLNHGGHNFAAGFSFENENFDKISSSFERYAPLIELSENPEEDFISIDAELPVQYLQPQLLEVVDIFEPYGDSNKPIVFMTKNLKIISADLMGKTEKLHLKLTFNCGKYKWPALFWNEGERLGRDFNIGDTVDVIFQITRNVFNGKTTPQMILIDCIKSK